MNTPGGEINRALDLTNCDKEPIHIPGAVQPHGVLLRLEEPQLLITHVSSSIQSLLQRSPEQIVGRPLAEIIDEEHFQDLQEKLRHTELARHNPHKIVVKLPSGETQFFDGIAHRFKGSLILELEPSRERFGVEFTNFYHQARASVQHLRSSKNIEALFETVVSEVRSITGFDRVLIYKFDENWNGRVLAEDCKEGLASYLDLHFPASDIPRQARELYLKNRLRLIPTVHYEPSSIIPDSLDPSSGEPLDLSLSVLRSVSPIHREYLRNMGATASMSVSLIKDGRLWGLISCVHESGPLYVPFDVRAICDFIGETMSSLLPLLENEEDSAYRMRLLAVQSTLLQQMTQADDFIDGLTRHPSTFLEIANATSGAIYYGGKLWVLGQAPDDAALQQVINWLSQQQMDDVLCETSLPMQLPASAHFKDKACGLLAFSISKAKANYFIWFRPEVVQTVAWGGNPAKRVETEHDGSLQLHPRKSFEMWKETVRSKCLPWKEEERLAVAALRSSIIEIVLQRMERLAKLNAELERSNNELDSFAYAASHDLKEPLRGIYNYVNVVLRDAGQFLPEDSQARLQTVSRLTQRMEDLINSLLHYSQIGRVEIMMRQTDLNELVKQALETLKDRIEEEKVDVLIPEKLPSVVCDRVQMLEVFTNLIGNAIKYNDKPHKTVTISCTPNTEPGLSPIFCIEDNGIGIDSTHFQSVFKIFKRLHPKQKFGGGTGTGLTITKKVIEQHGGSIWLESELGKGTRFYFTIAEGHANVE
jgi:light-regulated signal transduction histidine kinase (bacteriophytochrome)